MLYLRTTVKPVLSGIFVHTKKAIHRCFSIHINQAVTSTSYPAGDFREKVCVFLNL